MARLLETEDLCVSYGPIEALSGVRIAIDTGEIAVLLGTNGAGKSTLMRSLIGLAPNHKGTVSYCGRRIDTLPVTERVKLGIASVLEGRGMLSDLSVLENLRMGAYTVRTHFGDDIEKVFSIFPILRDRQQQLAGTLSGGEQQMLAFGRALMQRPQLILMDEPSMGMAPVMVEKVFDAIETINKLGTTILLVEQNARMALSVASHFYVISNGAIVTEGRVRDGELLVERDGQTVKLSEADLEAAYLEGK